MHWFLNIFDKESNVIVNEKKWNGELTHFLTYVLIASTHNKDFTLVSNYDYWTAAICAFLFNVYINRSILLDYDKEWYWCKS